MPRTRSVLASDGTWYGSMLLSSARQGCAQAPRRQPSDSTVALPAAFVAYKAICKCDLAHIQQILTVLCPALCRRHVGVHFSYFFSTPQILSKLRSFLHADDANVRAVTHHADAASLVERKVATCTAVTSRGPSANMSSIQLVRRNLSSMIGAHLLPAVPGWPKHPIWQ